MKSILISVVDDFPEFTSILAAVLSSTKGLDIAFIADNGVDFFTKLALAKRHPDVVLMDLSMPHMNGIDATKMIKNNYPDIKVIIMTNHDDEAFIVEMIEQGAEGYLLKNEKTSKIIEAIYSVNDGNKHYSIDALAKVSNSLNKVFHDSSTIMNTLFNISTRELQVLRLICKAKNNMEISKELSISERTVETHRKNLIRKTGAKNTVDLILMALYHKAAKIDRPSYMKNPFLKLNTD